MKPCAHCEDEGEHDWNIWLCAEGRKKKTRSLCTVCDIRLNYMILTFFNDENRKEKIQQYKRTIE